jgi:AcrR family transcriptional regulator
MIDCMARRRHAGAVPSSRRLAPTAAPTPPALRGSIQRQRLLGATTRLAISDGYTAVTVAQVIALAGVSRSTFYEYFTDMEACFAAALLPTRRRLLAGIRGSVARDCPENATLRATHALVAFAGSRPGYARLLMSDALSGGSRLRDARDGLVEEMARIIEDAHRRLPSGAVVAELPPRLICGVICRLLGSRLRRGGSCPSDLTEELLTWIAAYELPVARHRWRTLTALPTPDRSPYLPAAALRAPPALTPERPRTTAAAVAENQWLRIVFATAEVIRRDGYAAATVAQIAQAAGVDSRAFYRLFASKKQALAAAGELLFRHAMAVAAGAFVAGEGWPEQVWEAACALLQYAEQNSTLTYVSLVESLAGGSSAIGRVEDLTRAFTIFLQDRSSQLRDRSPRSVAPPSDVALEAIAMAAFELAYWHARHARQGCEAPLSTLLAPIVFIALAPFLGADAASDFVCRQPPHGRERPLLANAA